MWAKAVLIGYFLVQYVDYDNGQYNVLMKQVYGDHHNMVAVWTKNKDEYKENTVIRIKMDGKCSQVYEVLEGNGKRGSPWSPEDDWYLNDRPYVCNADTVERLPNE